MRKVGSVDQCPARALLGHTLCGRHAKCRRIVIWADANASHGARLVRCQAFIRGWLLRKRLALSGPGVLSRNDVLNEDDPVTLESKQVIHPFEYFGFKEGSKVFWFEFDTLYTWCLRSPTPTNPFTKVPLSVDVRKRLRDGWSYRQRHGIQIPTESAVYEERVLGRWTLLCQLFEDCGFGHVEPQMFLRLTKSQYRMIFLLVRDDISTVLHAKNPSRERLLLYCTRGVQRSSDLSVRQYVLQSVYTLLTMLARQKDPYTLAFVVLSALYRC